MNDLISRQAAIDALHMHLMYRMGTDSNKKRLDDWINSLPSAQETHEERMEKHACDLISRQAAIDALGEGPVVWSDDDEYALGKRSQYDIDRLAIETVSSAQPEIIRCKDCKWSEEYVPMCKTYYYCRKQGLYGKAEEDFCSQAERREEGDK